MARSLRIGTWNDSKNLPTHMDHAWQLGPRMCVRAASFVGAPQVYHDLLTNKTQAACVVTFLSAQHARHDWI